MRTQHARKDEEGLRVHRTYQDQAASVVLLPTDNSRHGVVQLAEGVGTVGPGLSDAHTARRTKKMNAIFGYCG